MRKRMKRGEKLSEWERKNRQFFEEKGWEIIEVEERREKGSFAFKELERRDIEKQRKKR